ncbi:MAG: AAA family ATPase [Clostridia bacterium]|nr:AAA family ATPase [Clostridia bacterium]
MEIQRVVITGGPCAGKTTAMSWIQNAFSQRGYTVLFIPETATELISGGVCPWTCGTNLDYQMCQMELQLKKEALFDRAAKTMRADKILIVCDRGAMDNKAYMNDQEFQTVLERLGLHEVELRDHYNAVFHLVTAANGAVEAYTFANNQARYESVEEAVKLDDRLIAAWSGHPHLKIIDNSTGFEQKMHRLLDEMTQVLGAEGIYNNEHKYLIAYPDIRWLESLPGCRKVEIYQTYLLSEDGVSRRIRQRGADGYYLYYEMTKTFSQEGKVTETERRLSQDEYLQRMMQADTAKGQIRKTRYVLTMQQQSMEIDLYPFWQKQALAKIALRGTDMPLFPQQIRVLREVTGEKAFRNSSMAVQPPKEEIE